MIIQRIGEFIDPDDGMIPESEYPDDLLRNEKFQLAGKRLQFYNVYRTQMKLYTHDALIIGSVLLIASIPLIALSGVIDGYIFDTYLQKLGDTGESYAALCLGLLSLMMALISSIVCGPIIPNEFRSRTAYLNLPLPQDRQTFYLGKFFAGFTVVLCMVLGAFAVVIFLSTWKYGGISGNAVLQALAVTMFGTFACCATAFALGAFLSKSSTMVPFILLFMIMPMIGLIVTDALQVEGILCYIPCFSGDVALSYLGSNYSLSVSMLLPGDNSFFRCIPMMSILASTIWGIVALVIGMVRINRRDM